MLAEMLYSLNIHLSYYVRSLCMRDGSFYTSTVLLSLNHHIISCLTRQ